MSDVSRKPRSLHSMRHIRHWDNPGPREKVAEIQGCVTRAHDALLAGEDGMKVFLQALEGTDLSFEKMARCLMTMASGENHPDFPRRPLDSRTILRAQELVMKLVGMLKGTDSGGQHVHLHGGALNWDTVKKLLPMEGDADEPAAPV